MATHSSVLAWRIPWMDKPGSLQSMGPHRVGHDWSDLAADSILNSRDITLPTNVRLVKAMVFPVLMYGCESWTVKKDEHQRIDAFELWCWRILLRVLWTARRSNQSILKEISPRCSLEGLMLNLKLQYFGHLMWRAHSLEKTLMLGKSEGRRKAEGQRSLACCSPWVTKIQTWLSNWTTMTMRRQHRWGRMVSAAYLSTKDILVDLKMVSKKRCSNCNSWNLWQLSYLEKKDIDVAKLRILI